MTWIVALPEEYAYAYGPFGSEDLANAFAKFASAEIDPARVLRIGDPTGAVLHWRDHVTKDPSALPCAGPAAPDDGLDAAEEPEFESRTADAREPGAQEQDSGYILLAKAVTVQGEQLEALLATTSIVLDVYRGAEHTAHHPDVASADCPACSVAALRQAFDAVAISRRTL